MTHYEVKISFTNQVTEKKDNETIIVYAENLTDIQVKVTEEYKDYFNLDIEKVSKITNVVFRLEDYNTDEHKLFKVKIGMVNLDERTGKDKITYETVLFPHEDFDSALVSAKSSLLENEFVNSLQETSYKNFLE